MHAKHVDIPLMSPATHWSAVVQILKYIMESLEKGFIYER